ncbi:GIY-YIG nuclease family protein [Echinicola strongylocentroti]|nr:GIY-YIG nuclease family protein [Echinicola strongylocentroti]
MMFWVYIIYSQKIDRFYIGYTENLTKRLEQHNHHTFKDAFTNRAADWQFFYTIECSGEKQATGIEGHLKKCKSRTYLDNLRKYPEISNKLKMRYSGS